MVQPREMLRNKLNLINLAVLVLGMLGCGLLSLSFGKELQWDLAGYHFYNPYAFLNHRINSLDYWPPSALQTYITPTFDFFSYYLIQHFSPKITEFSLGCLHGINAALIFYISRFFLAFFFKDIRFQIILAIALSFLGLYAPTVYSGIGAFFNDNTASIFVLSFVLLQIKILKKYFESGVLLKGWIVFANLLLGIAVGAKLPYGIYVIGAFAGLIFLPLTFRDKLTLFIYSALGLALGLILADGYWMWLLWKNFQNPFFPFFNAIFHSPYFPLINWQEPRYVPSGIIDTLLFPFDFSLGYKQAAELYFRDFRFAIVYVLFVLYLLSIYKEKNHVKFTNPDKVNNPDKVKSPLLTWLYVFFIFSYLPWQFYFSIIRYLGILQILAPLVCTLLVLQIFSSFNQRLFLLAAIFLFITHTMQPMGVERMRTFGSDYFNVKLPSFVGEKKTATVLLAYPYFVKYDRPKPNHYLIPFFPAAWRFSGIPFQGQQYDLPSAVRSFVQQGPKQVYLLSSADFMPYMVAAAKELGLEPQGLCGTITSDRQKLTGDRVLLCPFLRR
jgi:hypothetical protein